MEKSFGLIQINPKHIASIAGRETEKHTLSRRDSSMLLEYSFSLNSSLSMRELSMSAERWGMLDTQATVRSEAGVEGLRVVGDWEEPWGKEQNIM